jgi:oxygen-independent coproporphyrinogen III oxidase
MGTLPRIPEELVARLDVAGPRYTSYPTVPVWSETFGERQQGEALARAAREEGEPLSLYVHIPFCREMCSYCGCNVVVARDSRRAEPYLDALAREAALVGERLGRRRRVARLHFGGGTPTFLDEGQLERLWRALTSVFTIDAGAELAVEIDPVVTRRAQLALLAGFGFRRLSMGVQDFDPDVQAAVRRLQTVDETRAAVDEARALGYTSVNFDLIYGLPHQTPASWRRTLASVAALAPDRVAAFSFAFVPEVKPHQRRLASLPMARGADKLALFRIVHEELSGAGYRAIGMDHFALPGDELARAQERHALWRDFQGYTTRRANATVALGASAISDVGGAYAQNVRTLAEYARRVAAGRLPVEKGVRLDGEDLERRRIITELMCNFCTHLGEGAAQRFAPELAALEGLARDGLVEVAGERVAVTPLGRLFVRNVAMVFDEYLQAGAGRYSRTV